MKERKNMMQDYVFVEIKEFYKKNGRMPGIRELQRYLWYASPRSVAIAYERLVEEWKLAKTNWKYELEELKSSWKTYEWSKEEIVDFLDGMNPLQVHITGSIYFTVFYK